MRAPPTPTDTIRLLGAAVLIEQSVEGRYLRAGRALTYGPIRQMIESLAAEVRDHERILGRHLRDTAGRDYALPRARRLRRDSRRRARATPGSAILTPPALVAAFRDAFQGARRAARFHRGAASRTDNRFTAKILQVIASNHEFHLELMDRILTGVREGPMSLTPGRKLATVDLPWVRTLLEGGVPEWMARRSEGVPTRRFYMAGL
jgi:rubrerythrin